MMVLATVRTLGKIGATHLLTHGLEALSLCVLSHQDRVYDHGYAITNYRYKSF
jgi:hypothetical protein